MNCVKFETIDKIRKRLDKNNFQKLGVRGNQSRFKANISAVGFSICSSHVNFKLYYIGGKSLMQITKKRNWFWPRNTLSWPKRVFFLEVTETKSQVTFKLTTKLSFVFYYNLSHTAKATVTVTRTNNQLICSIACFQIKLSSVLIKVKSNVKTFI